MLLHNYKWKVYNEKTQLSLLSLSFVVNRYPLPNSRYKSIFYYTKDTLPANKSSFFSFIAHNHLHSIHLFKFNCNTHCAKTNILFLKLFTLILKINEKGVYISFSRRCVCRLNYLMYTVLAICIYILYTRFNDWQSYEYIITRRRHVSDNRSQFKCKSSTHRHQ